MHKRDAIRAFVDSYFDGDATQAVKEIAAAVGVAVAYQSRQTLESHADREFTDEEWADVVASGALEDYDEFLDNHWGNASNEWLDKKVLELGLDRDPAK